MNRRGQVTVFMILGLIILLSGLIYVGLKSDLSFFNPDSIIAPDKVEVKSFVEACLRETVQDAITLVAFQGGYTIIEEGPWKISNGGNYQEFLGKNGFKIPYWQNNGKSFMPTQDTVERQIEIYINNRLDTCLNNFSSLRDSYSLQADEKPSSIAILGRGRVSVELDYPVIIKTLKDRGDTEVNDYRATVNTNMLGALELAQLIKNYNDLNLMLYNRTINMISGSELPFKGYEFDCSDKVWTMEQLETEFDQILNANIRYLTFKNTFNEQLIPTYPYPNYYGNQYFFDIGAERRHQMYNVDVQSLGTSDFGVFPSKGGVVRNIDLQLPAIGDLIDPCVNLYNHFYSMDYAIKFSVTDSDGLRFNFILPMNMAYNKPKILPEQFDAYTGSDDVVLYDMNYTTTLEDYCEDSTNNFDVYVEDEISRKGIINATVYYDCVKFRCEVGKTDYPRDDYGIPIGRSGKVTDAGFPECINGNLVVEHPNYISNNIFLTPTEQDEPLTIKLKPIIEVPVELTLTRFNGDASTSEVLDYENYTLIITVTNKDLNKFEYSSHIPGLVSQEELMIRIPINDSGDNNISFDIRALVPNSNISLGGYINEQVLSGRNLAKANKVRINILTSELDPTTQEEVISVYKDIVFTKSKLFPVRIS